MDHQAKCPQPWQYSVYCLDCETNQWTWIGDMTAKRMSCHALAFGNKFYVVGGYFRTQRGKTLDCYNPTSDTWNCITTVPYSLIPTAFVSTCPHESPARSAVQ